MSDSPTTMTRRHALLTGASGALAMPFIVRPVKPARAETRMMGLDRPTHYRFPLGDFEVTMLFDGARRVDGPHPIFGENQDPDEVAAYAEENFLPGDRMEISFAPVLVNTGAELVLFDTGNAPGGQPDVGNLPQRLEAAGYEPGQIDVVAISHCHPDHIGGLMNGGEPTYPNARYAIGRTEYDWWTSEAPEDQAALVQSNVVPLSEQMTFLEDGDDVVSGITAMATFGHTPGHMAFHIESNGQRLLNFADVTNHYVASLRRPDWHVVFDHDKEAAVETRRRVLYMLATERIPAVGYHMPFPSIGFVERTEESFRWVPASYQLHV